MRAVLIVDDNLSLAENLAEILSEEGLEAHALGSAEAALAYGGKCDFALLDVRMPGMDGVTLFQQLRDRYPNARFALMTAYATDTRLDEAALAGIAHVFSKPLPLGELVAIASAGKRSGPAAGTTT